MCGSATWERLPPTNVTVEPESSFLMLIDKSSIAILGLDGPTIEPHEAIDLSLMIAMGQTVPTYALVSWDGVTAPVRVPIPPE